jgi:dipeptidyl aminopeptidase/acylaminoacyl peptidase
VSALYGRKRFARRIEHFRFGPCVNQMKANPRSASSFVLALYLCAAVNGSPWARAQESRNPLSVEECLELREFAGSVPPAVSPDGRMVVYAATNPARTRRLGAYSIVATDLWILDRGTGVSRNLTDGTGTNDTPRWSSDGNYLAFCSDHGEGQRTLWAWQRDTGKMLQLSLGGPCSLSTFEWLPRSHQIVFSREFNPDVEPQQPHEKIPEQPADARSGAHVLVYNAEVPEKGAPAGHVDSPPSRLGRVFDLLALDVDEDRTDVLARQKPIASFLISPDGRSIAIGLVTRFEQEGSQQVLFDLAVEDIATHNFAVLAHDVEFGLIPTRTISWSPDSAELSYRTSGELAQGDVYVVPSRGTAAPRRIAKGPRDSGAEKSKELQQRPLWDGSGKFLYFVDGHKLWRARADGSAPSVLAAFPSMSVALISRGSGEVWRTIDAEKAIVAGASEETKRSGFYTLDTRSGQMAPIYEGDFAFRDPLFGVAVSENAQEIVYLAQTTTNPGELVAFRPEERSSQELCDLNPSLEAERLGRSREIHWRGLDGEQLHGALLLPAGYHEGTRYPLVVEVYGGLLGSEYLNRFGFEGCAVINAQLLATRGYAVLCPDAPLHVGSPREDLAKTVLPGVNKVVEMGIADPKRLAVVGHSYGGYSVLSLITETPMFKAAAASGGFGDLASDYGAFDKDGTSFGVASAESGQLRMGGTPWDFRSRYIENSPFFFLDRVSTPLLLLHGADDATAPAFLSDQIFVGLRRLGKTVVYAKYEGESHSPLYWSPDNRRDYFDRVLGWLDRYLKQQDVSHSDTPPSAAFQSGNR